MPSRRTDGWIPAPRTKGADKAVERANRRFRALVVLLLAAALAGRITAARFRARLRLAFAQQARVAFLAGKRTYGNRTPLTPADEQDVGMVLTANGFGLDAPWPDTGGGTRGELGRLTVAGLIAAIVVGRMDPKDPMVVALLDAKINRVEDEFRALQRAGEQAAFRTTPAPLLRPAPKPISEEPPYGWQPQPSTHDVAGVHDGEPQVRRWSRKQPLAVYGEEPRVQRVRVWWVLGWADHCPDCIRFEQMSPFYLDALETAGIHPGSGHTRCRGNCFPSGTLVAGAFTGGYRMHYRGQVIHLETASGRRLTVTPNHPIATAAGFTPAGVLREGDELVCYAGELEHGRRVRSDEAVHEDDAPARIEEVLGALGSLPSTVTAQTARFPEDFHGDAALGHGDVDVVRPLSHLLDHLDATRAQQVRKVVLVGAAQDERALVVDGAAVEAFGWDGFATDRSMGSAGESTSLSGRQTRHTHTLTVGPVADANTLLDEPAGESAAADAKFVAELQQRHPAAVSLDRVVKIERRDFDGHVYDLSTVGGWYVASADDAIAGGIVVGNCACHLDYEVPDPAYADGEPLDGEPPPDEELL